MAFWGKVANFFGWERVRARDEKGRYIADDKSTPNKNEAYTRKYVSKKNKKAQFIGAVAQLGERLLCTQQVVGSIPSSSTSSKTKYKNDTLSKEERLAISKNYTVAPAYNKGAYQVIPRGDVEWIGKQMCITFSFQLFVFT